VFNLSLIKLVTEAASLEPVKPDSSEFKINTPTSEYFFNQKRIEGDFFYVYSGHENNAERMDIILKLIKDPQDNDLAQNEIRILQMLHNEDVPQLRHLPKLLDRITDIDSNCLGLILTKFNGYNLNEIRKNPLYLNGVSDQHMAWILCRLLSVIGYAHKKGIIHGNIEPANILIQPKDHNLCLIDWAYSVYDPAHTSDTFKIFNQDFSAPEIVDKKILLQSADLYSVGKCMVYLLGGDLKTNILPESVDPRIRSFLAFFLLPSPLQRAQDAWHLLKTIEKWRTEIWGEHQFQEFLF